MKFSAASARKTSPNGWMVACFGVLIGSLVVCSCAKQEAIQAKQDSAPLQVKTSPVSTRNIQRTVQSVGTMFPFDETIVSAEIEGRALEVKADLGDLVAKGAVLVRISDEEQKYLLAQNEAALRMALERVGLRDENDKIKDITQSSEARRARADLIDAEQRLTRTKGLVDQGIGSRSDFDAAEARFNSAEATYDQSLNTIGNLVQDIERQKAIVQLQRKKLRDTTVYAPFAGSIKERQVTPGLFVRPNSPLFTIVKTDPIRLKLEVPERMAPWIRVGQIAEVQVEAFDNRKFSGKIWRISPTVDQTKRTFIVEALVQNPKNELKPGSYARASLPTNKVEHILLVPLRAVSYVFGANKTFVVRNGNTIEAREVKTGDRFETDIEVIEGLQEGDVVATTQLARLDTGTKVSVSGEGPAKSARKAAD